MLAMNPEKKDGDIRKRRNANADIVVEMTHRPNPHPMCLRIAKTNDDDEKEKSTRNIRNDVVGRTRGVVPMITTTTTDLPSLANTGSSRQRISIACNEVFKCGWPKSRAYPACQIRNTNNKSTLPTFAKISIPQHCRTKSTTITKRGNCKVRAGVCVCVCVCTCVRTVVDTCMRTCIQSINRRRRYLHSGGWTCRSNATRTFDFVIGCVLRILVESHFFKLFFFYKYHYHYHSPYRIRETKGQGSQTDEHRWRQLGPGRRSPTQTGATRTSQGETRSGTTRLVWIHEPRKGGGNETPSHSSSANANCVQDRRQGNLPTLERTLGSRCITMWQNIMAKQIYTL